MSRAERDVFEREDEIIGFMRQTHISKKKVARLNTLLSSPDAHTCSLASNVLRVAAVKPHKRRRLEPLRENHPALLRDLVGVGLVPGDYLDQATEVGCAYPSDRVVGDSEEECPQAGTADLAVSVQASDGAMSQPPAATADRRRCSL